MAKKASKPKRDTKTGQFVSNKNTPFAPAGAGIPRGWTPTVDKSVKKGKQKLPKVIHNDRTVDNAAYYNDLIGSRIQLAKKLNKDGLGEYTPRMEEFAAEVEKQGKRDSAAKARKAKAAKAKKEQKAEKENNDSE